MNHSCVVRAHGAGLFSNINKILVCMRIYEHVHVDWSAAAPNDPAFKYGGSFYGNCWDALFEPTTPPEPPFDTIYEYPFYEITGGCAGVLYQNEQWGWRKRYHEQWQKLKCKVQPVPVPSNTIGVLIRSEALGGEQLSGRSQTLEDYADAIEDVKAADTDLFVVSSDEESIRRLRLRFPRVCCTEGVKRNTLRSDPEQHIATPQTSDDAVQVMREVLTLASCQYLISGVSNMATAALYMNPSLRSIYLR